MPKRFPLLGRMPRQGLLPLLCALAISLAVPAGAGASDGIEGVWTFNGGKVAVQAAGDGSFFGVVVEPTTFSECSHPVGESIWTQIRPQPDGSYWGLHQWYFGTTCDAYPEGGPTAWRILNKHNGSRSLEVCFSEPGGPQPQIAVSGSATGADSGCSTSDWVSGLPPLKPGDAPRYILLPVNGSCLSRSKLQIRLHDPQGDPLVKVSVLLSSGPVRRSAKLARRKKGVLATLNLRGLTRPNFKVSVRATTALGVVLKRQRSYRLCDRRPIRPGKHG
jgi:hypothetical protein